MSRPGEAASAAGVRPARGPPAGPGAISLAAAATDAADTAWGGLASCAARPRASVPEGHRAAAGPRPAPPTPHSCRRSLRLTLGPFNTGSRAARPALGKYVFSHRGLTGAKATPSSSRPGRRRAPHGPAGQARRGWQGRGGGAGTSGFLGALSRDAHLAGAGGQGPVGTACAEGAASRAGAARGQDCPAGRVSVC